MVTLYYSKFTRLLTKHVLIPYIYKKKGTAWSAEGASTFKILFGFTDSADTTETRFNRLGLYSWFNKAFLEKMYPYLQQKQWEGGAGGIHGCELPSTNCTALSCWLQRRSTASLCTAQRHFSCGAWESSGHSYSVFPQSTKHKSKFHTQDCVQHWQLVHKLLDIIAFQCF